MTIAAFNRIRIEEGEGASADWLGTGLCYAALAGANPQLAEPASKEDPELPAIMPPTLTITSHGGAIIRFADLSVASKPMQWTMVFDARRKLIKASHAPANIYGPSKREMGELNADDAKP